MRFCCILMTYLLGLGLPLAAAESPAQCSSPSTVSACEIDAAELQIWQKRQDLALIDLRSASSRRELRIPGALDYPLYALKTKSYLKNRAVLLSGDGFHRLELERGCLELRQKGFKEVKVLKGGIQRWAAAGGRVEGPKKVLSEVQTLSAADVYTEMAGRGLLLIDVSKEAAPPVITGASRYVHLSLTEPLSQFSEQLAKRLAQELKGTTDTSIVLFNDSSRAEEVHTLEALISALKTQDIWLLKGGRQSLAAFAAQNRSMLEHLAGKEIRGMCR